MKTTSIWMGGLMALAVLAAQSGRAAGERTFGDGTLPEALKIYDVDDDGVLSQEERQAMTQSRNARHDNWVAQWDTDANGVVSATERLAAREVLRLRIVECRTARFNEADTDHDGFISLAEFTAIPAVQRLAQTYPDKPAAIFDRLDADDNQKVSLEEFLAHLSNRRPGAPATTPPAPGGGNAG